MSSMYPPLYGGGIPPQRCQRCGTPLPPNEAYCRTCGMYTMPPAQAQTGGTPPGIFWGEPTPYGGGQIGGQPSAPPSANTPYGSGTNPPQQPFPNNAYGGVPNSPSSPNNFSVAPSQNGYAPASFNGQNGYTPLPPTGVNGYAPSSSTNTNGYASPSPGMMNSYQPGATNGWPPSVYNQLSQDEPSQKRRGPNVGLIVGIVVLLLLLVGGGVGGYVLISKNRTGNPTLVTPTVTLKPTPTPTGKMLFSDTFTNNNKNGWDLTNGSNNKVTINLNGGSLVLADNENTLFPEFIPGRNFSDFQLNIDAVLSKGSPSNGYGVYIRVAPTQNDSLGTYYRFELYGDSTYAIFKGAVGATGKSSLSTLMDFTNGASIQKPGTVNHITIVAQGAKMQFIVNGVVLTTVTDPSYKSGAVALFVSNVEKVPAGAEATFSHLTIYSVAK